MILTSSSQGKCFRRTTDKEGTFYDIRRVGKGFTKLCFAITDKGPLWFITTELEIDWVELKKKD